MEAKESKRSLVYFPYAGVIQPLPRKQGFSTPASCWGEGQAECWGDSAGAVPGPLSSSQGTISTLQPPAHSTAGRGLLREKSPSQPEPVHLHCHGSGVQGHVEDLSFEFPLSTEKPGGLT